MFTGSFNIKLPEVLGKDSALLKGTSYLSGPPDGEPAGDAEVPEPPVRLLGAGGAASRAVLFV